MRKIPKKQDLFIKKSIKINAPAEEVWDVLINPKLWWTGVVLQARVGGKFEEQWNGNITAGEIVEFNPPKKLKLSWKDTDWPDYTYVTFSLTRREQATIVELLHEGWEIFPKGQREELISDHQSGWQIHLDDLKEACERSKVK